MKTEVRVNRSNGGVWEYDIPDAPLMYADLVLYSKEFTIARVITVSLRINEDDTVTQYVQAYAA